MNAITDRLGIGDQIRELKLGPTLTSNQSNAAFHTIRYDFKPASVDREKAALLDVEANNKVTVTAPNTHGSGATETVFKGSRKEHQKECVLIIDHKTGEITLEKLNQNITVKRTRPQKPSKGHNGSKQTTDRLAIDAMANESSKKSAKCVPQKPNSPLTLNTNHKHSPNVKQKVSKNKANHSLSQMHGKSPSMSQPISPSMPTLSSLSMPSISSNTSKPSVLSIAHNSTKRDINGALGLSDSSSDSSRESSSSSSDSSSDDEEEDVPKAPATHSNHSNHSNTTNNANNNSSFVNSNPKLSYSKSNAPSMSANTMSMTDQSFSDDSDHEVVMPSRHANNSFKSNTSNGDSNVLPSMPKFSLLSEDLRLSESSGSDSEN